MARHQKQVGTAEIEALRRRHDRIVSAGGEIPQAFAEKYQRLRSILGDPAYGPEANQLAAELFVFLESGIREISRPADRRGRSQVKVDLEPRILAALDNFMAENGRVSDRPEAICMILNDALKARGFLKTGEERNCA